MKLLVIDDDEAIADSLDISMAMHQVGCEIRAERDGHRGLDAIFEWDPDIVILDIGLPELDGLTVLKRARERSSTRIIMLSAKDRDSDIAKALEMGADDYVTKPFSPVELLARIRAQGRRARESTSTTTSQSVFTGDGLEINFSTGAVRVDNRPVALSTTEYRLLFHLATNPGRLTTVTSLLQRVWRSEAHTTDIVRVYISRLRRKIEPDPRRPRYILTKSGLGYLFTPSDETWKDS